MEALSTVEAWCRQFIRSEDPAWKLAPPPPPDPKCDASWEPAPQADRDLRPGRPEAWPRSKRSPRSLKRSAIAEPRYRAQLVHTFLHHELQAAELFAWAVLAFPEAPRAFRVGLIKLCRSELDHLHLYHQHLNTLGYQVGAFAVRDWFWERMVRCASPAAFLAFQGLGLEGANLEHSARFAAAFRAAQDVRGAEILEQVEREEIDHVAFAVHWFQRFTGRALTFEDWCAALPAPITPSLLRGKPLNLRARSQAGFDAAFLEQLAAVGPATGSTEDQR